MEITLFSTQMEGGSLMSCELEYRGEGNANLVVVVKNKGLVIRYYIHTYS